MINGTRWFSSSGRPSLLINSDIIDKALKEHFGDTREYLQDYIFDESRTDWHFYISLSSNSNVLDIGTGWGAISVSLGRNCGKIFAADCTLESLEFLNIRAKQEGLRNLRAVRLNPLDYPLFPFSNSFFDLVVLNGILEWVGNVCLEKKAPGKKCLYPFFILKLSFEKMEEPDRCITFLLFRMEKWSKRNINLF